jgi:hypothetical protein
VGYEKTTIVGSPRKNPRIAFARQANVLRSNEVELRLSQEQSAQDAGIEILVREQTKHGLFLAASASEQALTNALRIVAGL